MITLIGKDLAKKGQEFVFLGPAEECENCRFKSSCVGNLEVNRKYVVVGVKENEQKCPIHSGGVVIPVEIDRAKIDLLTPSKNMGLSFAPSFWIPMPLEYESTLRILLYGIFRLFSGEAK